MNFIINWKNNEKANTHVPRMLCLYKATSVVLLVVMMHYFGASAISVVTFSFQAGAKGDLGRHRDPEPLPLWVSRKTCRLQRWLDQAQD